MANVYVWSEWTSSGTNDTSTWPVWISVSSTNTTTTSATETWGKWSASATNASTGYTTWNQPPPLSAEEQAKLAEERAAAAEKRRLEWAKLEEERKAADKRADELLRRHLSCRQRRRYRRDKSFTVRARDGTRFRIKHGWAGNVEELNAAGLPVNRFCIHPQEAVPVPDNLLAQKLLLEADPDKFRKIANRTAIPQPVRQTA